MGRYMEISIRTREQETQQLAINGLDSDGCCNLCFVMSEELRYMKVEAHRSKCPLQARLSEAMKL